MNDAFVIKCRDLLGIGNFLHFIGRSFGNFFAIFPLDFDIFLVVKCSYTCEFPYFSKFYHGRS